MIKKTALILSLSLVGTLPAWGQNPPAAPALDIASARQQIDQVIDRSYPALELLYRDIHSHPEVAFQEQRTATLLAARMRKLGFTVTEHIGKTGLVALYRNGDGPVVLVRTELDGLPMEEKTGLPYASQYKQVVDGKESFTAHSCGHDVHMTWWVGTAEALVALKAQWKGTLMFVAQPAEETVSGAKAMLADPAYAAFLKPAYGFAAHVGPLPSGSVLVKDGVLTSASDALDILFVGQGAHGSMPHKSIDPIMMGAHFATDVQTVISREKDPNAFGVVTIGAFNAGTVDNIIPDKADLKLTLRSHDEATRTVLLNGVKRTAKAASDMAGAPAPVITYLHGSKAVQNTGALTAQAYGVMKAAFGKEAIFAPAYLPAAEASEDYSEFVDTGIKSVFFAIGGTDAKLLAQYKAEGKQAPVNHSPYFAPDLAPAVRRGVETLALAVMMVAPAKPATGQ